MLRVNCNRTARLRLWAPSVGLCDGPEQLCFLQSPTSTEDRYSEQFQPSPGHKSQIVRVILSLSRSQALALAPAGGSMGISESPSLPRALPPAFPLFRSPTLPLPRSPSLLLSLSPFLASVNPARRPLPPNLPLPTPTALAARLCLGCGRSGAQPHDQDLALASGFCDLADTETRTAHMGTESLVAWSISFEGAVGGRACQQAQGPWVGKGGLSHVRMRAPAPAKHCVRLRAYAESSPR